MATARKRPREPRLGLLAAGRPSRSSGPLPLRLCSEHTKDTCMLRPGARLLAASPSFQVWGHLPLEVLLSPGQDFIPGSQEAVRRSFRKRGFPKATVEKSCSVSEGRESNVQNHARKGLIRGNSETQVGAVPFSLLTSFSALLVLPLLSPWSGSGCPSPESGVSGRAGLPVTPDLRVTSTRPSSRGEGRREGDSRRGGGLGAAGGGSGGSGEQLFLQASQGPAPGCAHHGPLGAPQVN